ncbi:hypothetical protein D3C86_1729450 [compost metagenome]
MVEAWPATIVIGATVGDGNQFGAQGRVMSPRLSEFTQILLLSFETAQQLLPHLAVQRHVEFTDIFPGKIRDQILPQERAVGG